jgi:hypothetical protein
MRKACAAIAVAGITACGTPPVPIVQVHILPEGYVVDGIPIATPGEAAKAAAHKDARELRVTACSMMPTRRITDFMAQIGPIHTGQITLAVFEPGVPQCPK